MPKPCDTKDKSLTETVNRGKENNTMQYRSNKHFGGHSLIDCQGKKVREKNYLFGRECVNHFKPRYICNTWPCREIQRTTSLKHIYTKTFI